jgi:hypothetical protein
MRLLVGMLMLLAVYDDERDDAMTISAFAGVTSERFRISAEGVWQRARFSRRSGMCVGSSTSPSALPSSLNLVVHSNWDSNWEDRIPAVQPPRGHDDTPMGPTYLLAALSYQLTEGLHLIPNVFWGRPEGSSDLVVGRFTPSASF